VAQVVARGWKDGQIVEIDGLGVFDPGARQGLRFEPQTLPQLFLAHVREDAPFAARLYLRIASSRIQPVDGRAQTPPWTELAARHRERDRRLRFLHRVLFVKIGTQARGISGGDSLRPGLRPAGSAGTDLDGAVRLDNCEVPRAVQAEFQWVDLFPDWERGVAVLRAMMRRAMERRRGR